ncbi:MAG: hypothetical protein ACSHYA_02555 [Opitutaceae bacterium]
MYKYYKNMENWTDLFWITSYNVVTVLQRKGQLLANWLVFPHARIGAKKTKAISQEAYDSIINLFETSELLTNSTEEGEPADDYDSAIAILYKKENGWQTRYATQNAHDASNSIDFDPIYERINTFLKDSILTYPPEEQKSLTEAVHSTDNAEADL